MKKIDRERRLPSRAVAYAYSTAMYFGQQLEVNLKAILYTADYHGWGEQIELDECQSKRFKDTDELIDKATCGLITEKLRQTGIIKGETASKAFIRACEHRNKLAHSFLTQINFDSMTSQKEGQVVDALHRMTVDIYRALLISRAVRERAELRADEVDKRMQELFGELMVGGNDPNRHYSTRMKKRKV